VNHEIPPHDASSLLEADEAVALDVREPDEWHRGHIHGAVHIPLGELASRLHELPQGKRIVAVCRSGARSGSIVGPLRQAGHDVVNLAGGLVAWHAHGLPLEPATGRVA
jgi:rhodanese-related sulfurtransferase